MHTIPHIRAVDTSKATPDKRRLNAVRAAATYPKKKQAFALAVKGLQRLGMDIDAIAASGSVAEIDAAMTKMKWSTNERMLLKGNLATVGAIA
jgi:hypothetical protein